MRKIKHRNKRRIKSVRSMVAVYKYNSYHTHKRVLSHIQVGKWRRIRKFW